MEVSLILECIRNEPLILCCRIITGHFSQDISNLSVALVRVRVSLCINIKSIYDQRSIDLSRRTNHEIGKNKKVCFKKKYLHYINLSWGAEDFTNIHEMGARTFKLRTHKVSSRVGCELATQRSRKQRDDQYAITHCLSFVFCKLLPIPNP